MLTGSRQEKRYGLSPVLGMTAHEMKNGAVAAADGETRMRYTDVRREFSDR